MWKTFQAEFKALWKSRLRFASWIILLFMPLIYGFLFLSSFWSPFKNTDRLPIVVVNLDKNVNGNAQVLVNKLLNNNRPLEFNGGSSKYKIRVTDATDIYKDKGKEAVEAAVNSGKYSAAFVIPDNYGKITADIKLKIAEQIARDKFSAAQLITYLRSETQANNGLIDFYNSFKMSYVAGEMTNMGSSLYSLIGDLLFPDASVLESIITNIEPKLAVILQQVIKAQTASAPTVVGGILAKADPATVKTVAKLAEGLLTQAHAKLGMIIDNVPVLDTAFKNANQLVQTLQVAPAAQVPTILATLNPMLTKLITDVNNLNVTQLLPMIKAIKTQVLSDLNAGNILVNHRTYGKREGVVGEHDILNTYGYGLSPYFLSIVLWAGALLMVFLFPNKRYIKTENTMKNMAGKTAVWILTGWIQTLLLFAIISIPGIFGTMSYNLNGTTVVIKQCINLGADQGYLILFGLFASTMFMLIVRGIVYTIRVADIGLFICVILLILQLVSSGGTFPVSMQPGFFKFLHKILPFTYTVSAIREIYWDTDSLVVLKDVGILLIIPAIFTATSIVSGYFWDKKTHYKRNGKTFYRSMDKNVGSL